MSKDAFILIIFGITLLSGLLPIILRSKLDGLLKHFQLFAAALILTIIFYHILPEQYFLGGKTMGVCIVAGILLQTVLERLTKGIEHGHVHHSGNKGNQWIYGLMIGLCAHSFLEGLSLLGPIEENPTHKVEIVEHFHEEHNHHEEHSHHEHNHDSHDEETDQHHHQHSHSHFLSWAILVHKIPVGLVLGLLLLKSNISNLRTGLLVFIFALTTPLSAYIGRYSVSLIDSHVLIYTAGVAVGMLFHIVSALIFERPKEQQKTIPVLLIVSGVVLGLLIS